MSYNIYDIDGFKDTIGSSIGINILDGIAKKLNLVNLKSFLDSGFSIDMNKVVVDLKNIDFKEITEIEDLVEDLIEIINDSKEIIILSNEAEL